MLHIIKIMKLSIIGKGGAGKSTITALLSLYLSKKHLKVAVFDADINMHIKDIFHLNFDKQQYLSNPNNIKIIRKYLAGNNPKINPEKFVKTTPPGNKSNFFEIKENNFLIKNYSSKINSHLYLFIIGSYEGKLAGLSCYHTNLAIFENILSHAKLSKNDVLITDMVAGIDSIANTLFMQFDLHFFIVEPNFESISVYKNYLKEIKKTSYRINIFPVVNKIENEDDIDFVKSNIKEDFFILKRNLSINKMAKRLLDINETIKDVEIKKFLRNIENFLEKINIDPNKKLKDLISLHKKYINLDYVKRAYGDLSYQVDEKFKF